MVLSAISDKIPGSNIISIDEARRNIQSEEKTAEDNKMTDTSEEKKRRNGIEEKYCKSLQRNYERGLKCSGN